MNLLTNNVNVVYSTPRCTVYGTLFMWLSNICKVYNLSTGQMLMHSIYMEHKQHYILGAILSTHEQYHNLHSMKRLGYKCTKTACVPPKGGTLSIMHLR